MILRPWSAVRLAALALACALPAASAHASLTGLGEVRDSIPELTTALPRGLPGPCEGALCDELEAPQPKTRVRGFELDLYCRLGGEGDLSCRPRQVWLERYDGSASERSVFTGHYFDTETNLYYAKARYFDPQLGRFLSQDSYLGELTEPPSLHRYLYANDNPTFYTDPTGHYSWNDFKEHASWAGDFVKYSAIYGYTTGFETSANLVTLGGYEGGKEAYKRHEGLGGILAGGVAGAANNVTLGGLKGAVDGFVEGGAFGTAKGWYGGQLDTAVSMLPVEEYKTFRDPKADGWDKSRALATGLTKTALLGLLFAGGAEAPANAPRVSVAEPIGELAAPRAPVGLLPAPRQPAGLLTAGESAGGARFIADASGNMQDVLAGRGTMNPVGPKGPFELEAGLIRGSGGPGQVYELPGSQLTSGKGYIGKTQQVPTRRWAAADHRAKTPTGKPPSGRLLAAELTPTEESGMEALLAHEQGLENLSNAHTPIDPTLPKNAARIAAARKVLEGWRTPAEIQAIFDRIGRWAAGR